MATLRMFPDTSPNLTEFGDEWRIVGDLEVHHLDHLRRIGDRMWIFGDMELEGLPELREVGGEVHVKGDLRIANCPSLQHLSADLKVEGDLYTDRPDLASSGAFQLAGQTLASSQWMFRKRVSMASKCPAEVRQLLDAMEL